MRMGSFIMGSLFGAAAVVYFSRNSRPTASSLGRAAGDSLGRVFNRPKQASPRESQARTDGLEKVGEMVAKDREVQEQVNEILEESGRESTAAAH